MKVITLIISDNTYNYGKFALEKHKLQPLNEQNNAPPSEHKTILVDCLFVHYLIKELENSEHYRKNFLHHQNRNITLQLRETEHDLIDYQWNNSIYFMVRERCELDHALSWMSTLGGAFSALGDFFATCAVTAGKISFHQLKLAARLKDPNIAARCKLYLSLSLIQRRRYKLARAIIYQEYHKAKSATVTDIRLIRMCFGIWSKLQYEHSLHIARRKLGKLNE